MVGLIASNIFAAGLLSDDENDRRVVHQSWLRRRGNDPMIGFAMNRFAVSHYVCPPDYPLRRFFDEAAEAGAGAVALTVRATREAPIRELNSILRDSGLKVSSLNSAGYLTHPQGRVWNEQDRLNRLLVEAAAELDSGVLCVISGGLAASGTTLDATRRLMEDRLADLAQFASSHDVRLGLEPIHPAEVMQKGCVNTIADAIRIIDPLDGVGLILDHFHSWWDADIRTAFTNNRAHISLLQFCNICEPDRGGPFRRGAPSDGGTAPTDLIRHAEACGYDGWYEFEIFDDGKSRRPVASLLHEASDALKHALAPQ